MTHEETLPYNGERMSLVNTNRKRVMYKCQRMNMRVRCKLEQPIADQAPAAYTQLAVF